ncbi:amidohydrolase family protein [Caballeronia ptereochthonis]|uniref:Hydroxydechloroatrazine ethylaminohydrolase n=1 Tax=Caballeronia ptereochthonis TaxID=1777144 RepID=A0A157ZLI1_9BURK|nr:amidohydrolase family protein [Caballeronia ptereochthonis]SAK46380.1 hydroxydechloroatrazine ethylaminohydrolase [Caballeronia ptereochthonis]
MTHTGAEMNALDQLACGSNQWVMANALYFDSLTHRFVRGDLEIEGERIERILAPHASVLDDRLDAGELVCVPGLIDADASIAQGEWHARSDDLVKHGITTAGSFQRGLSEADALDECSSVRRLIYVELDETTEAGIDAHPFESFHTPNPRCVLLPAVVPAHIWSASSLLAIASEAERMRRRLCVRLCATHDDEREYLQTRFFTEIGLLSYLSILGGEATLFGPADVSRQDAAFIAETDVNLVCGHSLMHASLVEHRQWAHWLNGRALAYSFDASACHALAQAAAEVGACTSDACDAWIDSLTHGAARALGLRDLGSIASGMRADLCLYDKPASWSGGEGSAAFADLLAMAKPRHVYVDGVAEVMNGMVAGELAVAG